MTLTERGAKVARALAVLEREARAFAVLKENEFHYGAYDSRVESLARAAGAYVDAVRGCMDPRRNRRPR